MITFLSEDDNNDMRAYIASCVGLLCRYMGRPWSQAIVDIIFSYFRDVDEQVRSASIKSVPSTARAILVDTLSSITDDKHSDSDTIPVSAAASSVKLLESFIPAAISLQKDASVLVRSTLADMLPVLLSYLWPPLGRRQLLAPKHADKRSPRSCPAASLCIDYTQQLVDTVSPVILKLLGDSDKTVCVRMLTALSANRPNEVEWSVMLFDSERTNKVLQYISPLASHHLWRARYAVCILLPCLAYACNSVESRAKVAAIAVPLVTDDVFEVSRTAARALCLAGCCDLVKASSDAVTEEGEPVQDMGRMWLDGIVLPQLHKMHHSERASVRIMALHMVAVIVLEGVIDKSDGRFGMLLDMALLLSTDKIPNVRLALATLLKSLAPAAESFKRGAEIEKIMKVLRVLTVDPDTDVSYFSSGALGAYSSKNGDKPEVLSSIEATFPGESLKDLDLIRSLEQAGVEDNGIRDTNNPETRESVVI